MGSDSAADLDALGVDGGEPSVAAIQVLQLGHEGLRHHYGCFAFHVAVLLLRIGLWRCSHQVAPCQHFVLYTSPAAAPRLLGISITRSMALPVCPLPLARWPRMPSPRQQLAQGSSVMNSSCSSSADHSCAAAKGAVARRVSTGAGLRGRSGMHCPQLAVGCLIHTTSPIPKRTSKQKQPACAPRYSASSRFELVATELVLSHGQVGL